MGNRKLDPVKNCETCGKRLERKRFNGVLEGFGGFKKRKYCSQICMGLGYVKDAPSYDALSKRAQKLRNDSCEVCGGTNRLTAHHINGDRSNNSLANIQTLCNNCHSTHHHHARRVGKTVAGRMELRQS